MGIGRRPDEILKLNKVVVVRHIDPLLKEIVAGTIAMGSLSGLIALLFWIFTGISPWPMLVLGEIAGFGFGVALLALTSPHRR